MSEAKFDAVDWTIPGRLPVFPRLWKDPILQELKRVQRHPNHPWHRAKAASRMLKQAEALGLKGDVWQQYLFHLLCEGDNLAGRTMERTGLIGDSLTRALAADLAQLEPFFRLKGSEVFGSPLFDAYEPAKPGQQKLEQKLAQAFTAAATPEAKAACLLQHYKQHGRGMLARFEAFCLDHKGRFQGIGDFPHFAWEDLIGCDDQKEKLLQNTRQFMAGRGSNNVLLTGARGTGKSTSVKALIPLFSPQGLRLVQIKRDQLQLLAPAMEQAGQIRSHRFIFFFDDLSFDENEKEYKYLKSAIDGGASPQPENVLLCATSNRRHLLKETWADRSDELEAEVFREDATNESISLSDRFGLILHFGAPSQKDYLAIIDHELRKEGITLDPEQLRVLGVRWEMGHSGRNGRIAKQFVQWYLGSHMT